MAISPSMLALYPVAGQYLCTEGSIIKHSSLFFMKPSIESTLNQEKDTFSPMRLRSKTRGGSDINIQKHTSPTLEMKELIQEFTYFDSSPMLRTLQILCITYSMKAGGRHQLQISFQLDWQVLRSTFTIGPSSEFYYETFFKTTSTGAKYFSIVSTTIGIAFWKKKTTPSRLSSGQRRSKKTSQQSHLQNSDTMFCNSFSIGKADDVFDEQGTIQRIFACICMTSSCSSLFSYLSWSRSLRTDMNLLVIIFNLSFVSANSFYNSDCDQVLQFMEFSSEQFPEGLVCPWFIKFWNTSLLEFPVTIPRLFISYTYHCDQDHCHLLPASKCFQCLYDVQLRSCLRGCLCLSSSIVIIGRICCC